MISILLQVNILIIILEIYYKKKAAQGILDEFLSDANKKCKICNEQITHCVFYKKDLCRKLDLDESRCFYICNKTCCRWQLLIF